MFQSEDSMDAGDKAATSFGEIDTCSHHDSDTGSGHLEVRCPSCHAPMEVAVDTPLTDMTCPACGSHFSLVDQSQATRMAPSLSTMGRFELIERIGVGGFGSVWKALDKQLDRTVAVKIPRQGGMTAEEQEKFFREARAAAQLRHPSIVSVHEVGRDGESVYIVSDFVRGVTLGDWLTGQQLTSREAAELCAKIADALHHAHEQGVVHRDLKPANIMIDGDGQPHLMDFGLARRDVGEVTMTLDGQVLGTPAYMSPEQALGEGHTADRRSDVYSLGVILFQLLTGELPFRGNARMLMHQVIHDEPPSVRKFNANVPKDLETITLKCLDKEPLRRYQTAAALATELRRFLSGEPIQARPIGRFDRAWRWCRRYPVPASLSAAIVLLLITIAVVSTSAALKLAIASKHEEKARHTEAKILADKLIDAIDARDWGDFDDISSELRGRFGDLQEVNELLNSAHAERKSLTSSDERKAQITLDEVFTLVSQEDYLRANLLISSLPQSIPRTYAWRIAGDKLLSVRSRIDDFLSVHDPADRISHLMLADPEPKALWQSALGMAEALLKQSGSRYSEQFGVLRILTENEDIESQVAIECDGICLLEGGGHTVAKTIDSGGFVVVANDPSNPPRGGMGPALRIGALRHFSIDVPMKFKNGVVTNLGTFVLKTIPIRDCGVLAISLKPEPALSIARPQIEICRAGFYSGRKVVMDDALSCEEKIAAGTYTVKVPSDAAFGIPETKNILVTKGHTTSVEIPAFSQRILGLAWRYRLLGSGSDWKQATSTIRTGEGGFDKWPMGDLNPVGLFVSPWDGAACTINFSNCSSYKLLIDVLPTVNEPVGLAGNMTMRRDMDYQVHEGAIYGVVTWNREWEIVLQIKSIAKVRSAEDEANDSVFSRKTL